MGTVLKSALCLTALIGVAGLATWTATSAAAQSGFTELIPSGPTMPPVAPGASAWDAGAKLAAAFLGWLSDQGLKSSINAKLSDLSDQIASAMPQTGGVLIIIGIQQSAQPDINGNYVRSVLDGFVAGAAATPKAAMDAYFGQDNLEAGVPDGFVRRDVYLWKAANSSNSDSKKKKAK